jgi:hypothetical protein
MAEREMISFQLSDGSVVRFHEHEFLEALTHEWNRGRRHYIGEEPGPPHRIIEALRRVSDEEMARISSEHGLWLEHLSAADEAIRGPAASS